MKFGILNLTGFIIVALMMVPNIIYALRKPGEENRCRSKAALILEQIGRYGSMAMMVLPVLVWEFGFSSAAEFAIWIALCAALMSAYYIVWYFYFKKATPPRALWLAILPSGIFIFRGLFLRHWLLVAFGLIFAAGHIYITRCNSRAAEAGNE